MSVASWAIQAGSNGGAVWWIRSGFGVNAGDGGLGGCFSAL